MEDHNMEEWYKSKISNITEMVINDNERRTVELALGEADNHVTRRAIQLLVVDEADRRHLLERVPIKLSVFSSDNDVEEYNNHYSKLALDTFGLPVPHEYFLAKYLIKWNCQHMAPNDAVRKYF
jgi:hypothetical protein